MRLYIDSASISDTTTAIQHGLAQGVTTNPSLLSKEPPHPQGYLGHLRDVVRSAGQDTPISVQPPLADLTASPRETIGIIRGFLGARNIAIKIPVSWNTLPLIRAVSREIPVNATCVFSTEQAIAAIHAGARFVSFFWCRMNDTENGVESAGGTHPGGLGARATGLVRDLIDRSFTTVKPQIICGSIRAPSDVSHCFAAGADIVTAPLSVLQALANNEHSAHSANKFGNAHAEWTSRCVALADEQAQAAGPEIEGGEVPSPI